MEDRSATIELLHDKYAGVLYDKCVRMLRDRQEAEDAVQETFVSAFRSLDQFRYGESHLPWLYRILEKVTDSLDDRSLEILVAHYLDGMDQSEIAGSLGISRRAVVKRLTAARKLVGSYLEEKSDG